MEFLMKKLFFAALALIGALSMGVPSLPVFASTAEAPLIVTSPEEIPRTGWYQLNQKVYYRQNGRNLKGLQKISDNYYYFNTKTGARRSGIVTIKGKKYYFSPTDGSRQKGFLTLKGKTYYFGKKGYLLKGHQRIQGKRYYFSSSGVMFQNRWLGKKYYYGEDGTRQYGWKIIQGKRYYLDPQTGRVTTGKATINGISYDFRITGGIEPLYGFHKKGSKRYYYDEETGEPYSGWKTIGNVTYYFSKRNYSAVKGWNKINKKYYYFNGKAALQTNTWIKDTYYVGEDGSRQYGLLTLDNQTYYLDKKTGKKTAGWISTDSNTHYFDANGLMIKNTWVEDRYLDSSGNMAKNTWVGAYYVGSDGLKTGKTRTPGLFSPSKKETYYLDENFEPVKGWVEIDGNLFHFDLESGLLSKNTWIDGFYVDENGLRLTDQLKTLDGKTYLFYSDGTKAYGLTEFEGNTYYFHMNTGVMETGLKTVGLDTYYFDPENNGIMVKGEERFIGNAYYKFGEDGKLLESQDLTANKELGQAIAKYALKFEGNPYVYGGTSLTEGADCSGFTMSVLAHFNISVPHNAAGQYDAEGGMKIPASALLPGDLVFYYKPIGHVAIYVGDIDDDGKGEVIHASNPQTGIKISDYDYTVITGCARFW
jgi:glucan-binding YG repeat protein